MTIIVQMYEIHAAVAAISIQGKTFTDICSKVPIADIFHSRRRRRDAVAGPKALEIGADDRTPANDTVTQDGEGPLMDAGDVLTEDSPAAAPAKVSPVEDHYDALWTDYDYDESIKVEADKARSRIRIDFNKYGPKKAGEKRVEDTKVELPDDIYCDLVDTLSDVCLQSSLLEIWKYDRWGALL